MPVPSSYNDITQDSNLRDFVGWVWYDRQTWVPRGWLDGKTTIMLRLESAHYNSLVVSQSPGSPSPPTPSFAFCDFTLLSAPLSPFSHLPLALHSPLPSPPFLPVSPTTPPSSSFPFLSLLRGNQGAGVKVVISHVYSGWMAYWWPTIVEDTCPSRERWQTKWGEILPTPSLWLSTIPSLPTPSHQVARQLVCNVYYIGCMVLGVRQTVSQVNKLLCRPPPSEWSILVCSLFSHALLKRVEKECTHAWLESAVP